MSAEILFGLGALRSLTKEMEEDLASVAIQAVINLFGANGTISAEMAGFLRQQLSDLDLAEPESEDVLLFMETLALSLKTGAVIDAKQGFQRRFDK